MATIDINRKHSLGMDVAREKAEQLALDMEQKLKIQWQWQGDAIHFKAEKGAAKGAKGQVKVSATDVRVEIDLPFLLRAMKGVISGKVEAKLNELMA